MGGNRSFEDHLQEFLKRDEQGIHPETRINERFLEPEIPFGFITVRHLHPAVNPRRKGTYPIYPQAKPRRRWMGPVVSIPQGRPSEILSKWLNQLKNEPELSDLEFSDQLRDVPKDALKFIKRRVFFLTHPDQNPGLGTGAFRQALSDWKELSSSLT